MSLWDADTKPRFNITITSPGIGIPIIQIECTWDRLIVIIAICILFKAVCVNCNMAIPTCLKTVSALKRGPGNIQRAESSAWQSFASSCCYTYATSHGMDLWAWHSDIRQASLAWRVTGCLSWRLFLSWWEVRFPTAITLILPLILIAVCHFRGVT